ncbi:MAG TPA: flagellar hook-basal body complex protein FliE [Gammaproteobacteria bacterium]|nr:flagellar hook-basal body complex protein FliE [Gammaproteobacteria bacterium]
MSPVTAIAHVRAPTAPGATAGSSQARAPDFLSTLDHALSRVSDAQRQAGEATRAVASGAPGASLEKALVASDRAKVAWNATVAVRNELVNAYDTVKNMPV